MLTQTDADWFDGRWSSMRRDCWCYIIEAVGNGAWVVVDTSTHHEHSTHYDRGRAKRAVDAMPCEGCGQGRDRD